MIVVLAAFQMALKSPGRWWAADPARQNEHCRIEED
jgi:hypothetical protein